MKTYRLCGLTVFVDSDDTKEQKIDLLDGLIINKEDEGQNWLMEMNVEKSYSIFFNEIKDRKEKILLEVVITNKDNHPASFVAGVREVKELETSLQILLDASRIVRRDNYSDIVLKTLLDKGISGEQLLKEFKMIRKERGSTYQLMIEKELKQINSMNKQ